MKIRIKFISAIELMQGKSSAGLDEELLKETKSSLERGKWSPV